MVALVDDVPRTLNLARALQGYVDHQVEVITRRSQFRLDKARDRAHVLEGLIKALDVIDAIIALIRGSENPEAAREGLMAVPFEFSEVQARVHPRHAPGPAHPAEPDQPGDRAGRAARDHRRARVDPRRRRQAAHGDQGRARRGAREVRHQAGLPGGQRHREHDRPRPRRRQGARRRDDRGAVHQDRRGHGVQDPGPWRPWRQRGQAQGRRPGAPRPVHHSARLPAVLLQPRSGVPAARAGGARARAHGQGHADRQPPAAAGGRDDRGDHRHPRLRRRAQPVLRHPSGSGQEDVVPRVRQRPARRSRSR